MVSFARRRSAHVARSVLAASAFAGLLAAAALSPAYATYPGANGRLAFGDKDAGGTFQIYSVKPDGTGLRQVTSGANAHLCAAFSADGRHIAYCGATDAGPWEIFTVDPDGGHQHQLTSLGGFAFFPDWSPDGRRLAFSGGEGSDQHDEIYVVDAHSGALQPQLTSCSADHAGCFNDYPAWSPDGTKIAYIHADDTDGNGNPVNEQVWVMNPDGSHKHQLTHGKLAKDQVPDWSPDGSKIAFNAGFYGNGGLWVMNANGSGAHQLDGCANPKPDSAPCAAGDDFGAAWSPDGTQIAFARDFRALGVEDRAVFLIDADGSHVHRLTTGPSMQAVPAWQPVGRR
jgi:TolB protein